MHTYHLHQQRRLPKVWDNVIDMYQPISGSSAVDHHISTVPFEGLGSILLFITESMIQG